VHSRERYAEIHMPRNTGVGLVMGLLSLALGFGLIWHIWWLAVASFVGMIASFIVRSFDEDVDYYVPIAEVERIENERHLRLATQG
jgi:cytochrome o ubiquinol oxidase subunit 1